MPWNEPIVTLGNTPVTSSSMPIRSSTVNRLRLLLFTSTATTTSSNSPAARPTMSRCPLVTGSKEPGADGAPHGARRYPAGVAVSIVTSHAPGRPARTHTMAGRRAGCAWA